MKTLTIAVILFTFIAFVASNPSNVICNNTENFLKYRAFIRDKIRNNTSIFLIVSYGVLDENLLDEHYEHFIANKKLLYPFPALILEDSKFSNVFFSFLAETKDSLFVFNDKLLHKIPAEVVSNRILVGRECLGRREKIDFFQLFKYSRLVGCSHTLFTCRISKIKNSVNFKIEKQVLVMTRGEMSFSDSDVNSCIDKSRNIEKPEFSEFAVEELCICNNLEYYLNDCSDVVEEEELKFEADLNQILGYGIIFVTFILLFATAQCFEYLIDEMEKV